VGSGGIVEGAMTAVLLYTMPPWVWVGTGMVLVGLFVYALIYCAAELDNDYDEQEAQILQSINDEYVGGVVRSFKVREFRNGKPRW
jgi:hypothetical protein